MLQLLLFSHIKHRVKVLYKIQHLIFKTSRGYCNTTFESALLAGFWLDFIWASRAEANLVLQ